jgi:hypothetical protein
MREEHVPAAFPATATGFVSLLVSSLCLLPELYLYPHGPVEQG